MLSGLRQYSFTIFLFEFVMNPWFYIQLLQHYFVDFNTKFTLQWYMIKWIVRMKNQMGCIKEQSEIGRITQHLSVWFQ